MIVFVVLLIAFGVCLILYPDIWWHRFEPKKGEEDVKPSRQYRIGARVTGGLLIAASALLLIVHLTR